MSSDDDKKLATELNAETEKAVEADDGTLKDEDECVASL